MPRRQVTQTKEKHSKAQHTAAVDLASQYTQQADVLLLLPA
jgi:hypothetical protein